MMIEKCGKEVDWRMGKCSVEGCLVVKLKRMGVRTTEPKDKKKCWLEGSVLTCFTSK